MVVQTDVHIKNTAFDTTNSCVIYEMFHYDWSKLMICLIVDNIIDTSTWKKKKPLSLANRFKNFLSENVIIQHDLSVKWSVYMVDGD